LGAFGTYVCPTLNAPGLVLEPLAVAHAGELFPSLQNPALYTYIPHDPPPSLDALCARYARLARRRSPDGKELWLNWVVRRDCAAVGTVQATCRSDDVAYVAYDVFVPFQRQGLATKAVSTMLDHLQASAGVVTAKALVDTRNTASIRLLERLGFSRIRLIENADHFKGARSDEYEYARQLGAKP
jgi:RimJ/RimL family protein N-acetyltransferase